MRASTVAAGRADLRAGRHQQELDRLQPTTVVVLGGPATVSDAADRDWSDFSTQAEAQAFYNFCFPYYGGLARLDGDNDGIACNALP